MKIVFITSSYPRFPGDGTAPFIKSIAEAMDRHGHAIEVVAPYDSEIRNMETNHVHINRFRYIWPAKFHIVGHARSLLADVKLRLPVIFLMPFFLIAGFYKLMKVSNRQRSQVIYAHWVLPNGFLAAWVSAFRKIPFVISVHGSDIYLAQKNWIFRPIAGWVFRHASAVTACSPVLQKMAISLHAPKDTILLPWGADPTIFHPSYKLAQDRRVLGWDQNSLVIASLGRMVYKKGFNILLAALPAILRNNPNIRLVLGGDGPLLEDLEHEVNRLSLSEHVSFMGRIPWDHVQGFLASSDIFILPSIVDQYGNMDGLPTVLLEAMSCGLPIVASDIGGVSMVIENGRTGIIVPPGDSNALANAICSLAVDPDKRHVIGVAARQAVEQQFNWDAIAHRLEDVLEKSIHTSART